MTSEFSQANIPEQEEEEYTIKRVCCGVDDVRGTLRSLSAGVRLKSQDINYGFSTPQFRPLDRVRNCSHAQFTLPAYHSWY